MSEINIQKNVPLAQYTSFQLGGVAESLVEVTNTSELVALLQSSSTQPSWLIGFGSNSLISDHGLPGLTVVTRGGAIDFSSSEVIVDAGVWWDDLVRSAVEHKLWGIELLGHIPGSVGAALYINITAYGQAISSRVSWIDIWNPTEQRIERLSKNDLQWSYKDSIFQTKEMRKVVILRACFQLTESQTEELTYQKALDVAEELQLNPNSIGDRRKIIKEARARAGSLWSPIDKSGARTVGSFFRNPLVDQKQVDAIIAHDESGKTKEQIENMNRVHGGSSRRVSAAHVMLAAGFKRGQVWGNVKLNEKNLLKIEALDGATAQEVYEVAMHIQKTCAESIGVFLEPEAQILGSF